MNDVYKLVDEVTNLRKKRGIKQVELRELCDVTAEYISKVENHRRTPSLKKLVDVCNILDVEIKLVKNKKKIKTKNI